jgi:hypothetical protein
MLIDDLTELLYIIYKAGIRMRPALDRDRQFEVMTMPVFIGTASEYLFVPLFGPLGVVQLVCRVEMLDPGQIDHDV